mgnify:CR=1 FL=1
MCVEKKKFRHEAALRNTEQLDGGDLHCGLIGVDSQNEPSSAWNESQYPRWILFVGNNISFFFFSEPCPLPKGHYTA